LPPLLTSYFAEKFSAFRPADPNYAAQVVDAILAEAQSLGASDVHLQPGQEGLELKFRLDGVLIPAAVFPASVGPNIITRLKVLAELLTYYTDRPQEGRIRLGATTMQGMAPGSCSNASPGGQAARGTPLSPQVEMRVSTFPTLHGERAVVRLFGDPTRFQYLADLGLPPAMLRRLGELIEETSGAIILSGPAGSGKTTTAYACLREIARKSGGTRSLVSLEDPIEVAVDGVAQSQVHPIVGLDLATGLKFLLRHDPEVIFVGEMRDRPTAEAAFQAALTGHLLLTTFHAGSAAETLSRLLDMGLEPYAVRSGLLAVLNQRLLRRLCSCAHPSNNPADTLGLRVPQVRQPVGCPACRGTGYKFRLLVGELLVILNTSLARAILECADTAALEHLAIQSGMISRFQYAVQAVREGRTSPAEIRRVFGFSEKRLGHDDSPGHDASGDDVGTVDRAE
jgi:general secretion pathway protein E